MNTTLLRQLGLYLLRILTVLLVIAGLLAWFAGSETALQWGAKNAERLSNGKLSVRAVHGSLYGPMRIEALSFQTDEKRFDIKEIFLDWAPRSLLAKHLQIRQLSVQELKITQIKPAAESAKLPGSMQLPLSINAPDIKLKRLVLVNGKSEQSLRGIHLGMLKSDAHYKLDLYSMDTDWGHAKAEILLGDTSPFTVTAHATMSQEKGLGYRAEANVAGSLVQLLLNANVNTQDGEATINTTLNPFEKMPIATANIIANGINPARFRKSLPEAALGAEVSLERITGGDLQGSVKIQNKIPGPWDQAHLPLRELSLQLTGTPDKFDLHELQLNMNKAGDVTGKGQLRNGQLQLDLSTTNLNPHELHSKIRQMRLAGKVRLQIKQQWQELTADLRYQRYKLHLVARHQNDAIQLRAASLQSATGSLAMHGKLALNQLMQFQLSGKLKNLNPENFGNYPEANINASFEASGKFAKNAQTALKFSVTNSHFGKKPLSGQGKIKVSGSRIWDSEILLQLGQNRLELKGGLGKTDDQLKLDINAPNLAEFNPELNGKVQVISTLGGSFSAPTGLFDVQADRFSWHNHFSIKQIRANGYLNKGLDGQLALDADMQDYSSPQLKVDQASLNAHGTRAQHTLQLMAKNPDYDIKSQLSGAWHDDSGWTGALEQLSNHGRFAVKLKSPAKLEVANQHFVLNQATFSFADSAKLVLHDFSYKNGHTASSGEIKNLPLVYIQNITNKDSELKTDLVLNGDWQFDIADEINGHIAIWRDSGDIALATVPHTKLGLNKLSLTIDAAHNKLQGKLKAEGTQLGTLGADGQLTLSRRNDIWGIAGSSLVNANLNLSVKYLSWIAPLSSRTGSLALDGALEAKIHADGTFAHPQLAGVIYGDHINASLKNQGLSLSDGSFKMTLHDQALILDQLSMHGGSGSLTGQGKLSLEGDTPVMQLTLNADKLEVLSRPDRFLILSGSAHATASEKKLQIESRLKVDQGLIELPKSDAVTSSDDVTVIGQAEDAKKKSLPYMTNFDLYLDLGERFYIKGKGLDAQLGGTLNLSSHNNALLSSHGNIRVIKGAYSAYGQRLIVERGILGFQGPLDNPGLDIIAMRKNQTVEAGVAVTGTAQAPLIKLVSTPDVPDSEKLSWLVLGYGLENSSGQDFNALNAAAGTLLAAGESITLQQKIAHATGFEDVSLRGSGELEGTVLSLGKRLSSRAYINYEQGLNNANNLVKINYTLSKRLSVQAQAGNIPAMDFFYTFKFD